jgi:hypothetical protein
MANEQPDYIFIECACDHSFEKNENNNRWINRIDGGVTIPENALLSVQYAGLNVLGSGSDVIEFKNEKIGESEIYKYNETTEIYDKVKYDVFDNKVTVFLEFYKNQDGLYNYALPYPHFSYSSEDYSDNYSALGNNRNLEVEEPQYGITTSAYNSDANYAFPIDNKRYTILKINPNSKYTNNEVSGRVYENVTFPRDMSNYEYSIYNNEVEIEIDKGFISPSSIAQQISQQLDKHTEPKKKTMRCWVDKVDYSTVWADDYVDIDGGITTETETFKLFNCATRRTFYQKASDNYNEITVNNSDSEVQQYQKNYEYIGCYNPSIFLTGRSILKDNSYDSKQQNFAVLNQVNCTNATQEGLQVESIYTNIPYDDNILKQFNYIFKYQEKDEEMYQTKPAIQTGSTSKNSRFLHSDVTPSSYATLNAYKQKRFGTDYSTSTDDRVLFTNPLYINYYSEWEGFQEDGAYGCFFPWRSSLDKKFYVRFDARFMVKIFQGYPYFEFYAPDATSQTYGGSGDDFEPNLAYDSAVFPDQLATYNRIGWDRHFSAHGNQCIMLWNGLGRESELRAVFYDDKNDHPHTEHVFSNSFIYNQSVSSPPKKAYYYDTGNDQIYLGADSFLFNFNTVESRFTMSQLHTSRKQFNNALSGYDASVLTGVQTDKDTGQPKIFYENILNAGEKDVQFPLSVNPNAQTPIYEISPTTQITSTQEVLRNYGSLRTNVIFDSNCGIYFGFFGITEKTYENSLWDILGFSKTQTHTYLTEDLPFQEILYRSNRFLNSGVNLNQSQIYPFTTNAQINSNEIISWRSNPFNISYFNTLNIPNNFRILEKQSDGNFAFKDEASPYRVIQNQISTLMFAEKLPRKTNIPFYQVRSDILPMVKYYGGNSFTNGRLPVLSLVNKSFSGTDYYVNQGDNSMEFIIKRRITINSVTTEIFDSNGRPAVLDPHSSVIYKFQIPYMTPQITPFKTSAELEEAEQQKQLQKTKKKNS